jgi:hypothetical protein
MDMKTSLRLALAFSLGSTLLASSKEQAAFAAVKGFYEAANHSECDKAETFYSDDAVKALKESLGPGGFSLFCLDKAGRAPLASIKMVKAEIKKDAAEILVERAYQDGSRFLENEHLVNEKGVWKLVAPPKQP